jgi:hypothetical protein
MFRNNLKKIQVQVDEKSTTRALKGMPNPKDIDEGSLVYVDGKGLFAKFKGQLKSITNSAGNIVVNSSSTITSNSTTIANNNYSIRLSHIVDLFNSGWITLAQQHGNIADSIKLPIDFTKINKITCYLTVSDGDTLYQKYVDTLTGIMTVNKGNSLEFALQYDSNFKLRLRVTEKNLFFQNVKQSLFLGKVVLNNGEDSLPDLQTTYTDNKLVIFLEMLINVS